MSEIPLLTKNGCVMCHYEESKMPHFAEYGRDRLDLYPVAETDHFKVKPDALPGEPNGRHFLLHPKFHTYNYAKMHNYRYEIGRVLKEIEARFGPMAIFEHGGTMDGSNNQSVYHAHAHLYGGLEEFDTIGYMEHMLSGGLGNNEVYDYTKLPAPDDPFLVNLKARYNGHPYLYVEQGPWAIFAEDKNGTMVSQISQRAMHMHYSGDLLGRMLNWKNIPIYETSARESVRRLAILVDHCNELTK